MIDQRHKQQAPLIKIERDNDEDMSDRPIDVTDRPIDVTDSTNRCY